AIDGVTQCAPRQPSVRANDAHHAAQAVDRFDDLLDQLRVRSASIRDLSDGHLNPREQAVGGLAFLIRHGVRGILSYLRLEDCVSDGPPHGAPDNVDTTTSGFLPRRSIACGNPRGITLRKPGPTA